MGKNWDYSDLSKMAKEFGGPRKMLEILKSDSFKKGFSAAKAADKPVKICIGIGSFLLGAAVIKIPELIAYFKNAEQKGELTAEEVAAIEHELVSGMEQAAAEESSTVNSTSAEEGALAEDDDSLGSQEVDMTDDAD